MANEMRSAFFWDFRQSRYVVFFTDVSGHPIGPIYKGKQSKKNEDRQVVPKRR
jgi:hypothetical protein